MSSTPRKQSSQAYLEVCTYLQKALKTKWEGRKGAKNKKILKNSINII